MGGALRGLDAGVVQGEGPWGAGGQRGGEGRSRNAGCESVDSPDTGEARSTLGLSGGSAHGLRYPRGRQGPLAAGTVRGGSEVSRNMFIRILLLCEVPYTIGYPWF